MDRAYKRHLITCALPYANGPLHIGHMAGVYIPADIYVRYLRLRGEDVVWVCGSDEHGVPITIRAKQEGVAPQQIVDKYNALIRDSFKEFGISFDIYHRTSDPLHHATASEFFKNLLARDVFVELESEQYYDTVAEQFLADRYITGTCPRCHAPNAYGDQCEACGASLNATDLLEPRSTLSGEPPVMRKTKHWYLPLDRYQAFLEEWILKEHTEWKTNVYGQCKSWLDAGLQPRAVSRDLDWGIPVPVEGAKGKVLYVWFDAPIGYISATKALRDDWATFWKSPDTHMVHFIGKDNIVFHCIVFPTMLKAHGEYVLPDNVPANEFLNLEGQKISTSRNWAVWLHEYLADFPGQQDVLRYVLTANMPETKDNDFTWKDFQSRNNSELVAILGNFVNRALVLAKKYAEGKVPASYTLTEKDREILGQITAQRHAIETALESFHFRDALKAYMQLARLGNKYLTESEPWKLQATDPARVQAILYVCLQLTAAIALLGQPFLPNAAGRIAGMLNWEPCGWDALSETPLADGHVLGNAELVFSKIEDAQIEAQIRKLEEASAANSQGEESVEYEPLKGEISIDDFSRVDLRMGTILTAERVPKADRLLKFTVDLGFEQRTIVSGVAEHYKPEELLGRQVVVVANLAPRKLRGIESKGMLLFADDPASKGLHAVLPDRPTTPGSTVA